MLYVTCVSGPCKRLLDIACFCAGTDSLDFLLPQLGMRVDDPGSGCKTAPSLEGLSWAALGYASEKISG